MAGTAELDIDVNAESEGVPRSRPDGTADTSGQDGEVVGDARPEPQLRNADTVGTAYSDAELNSEDEDVPPLWTEDAEGVTGRDAEVFAKDEGSPSWMDVPVELPSPRRERRSLCQVALAAELASERKACARAVAAAEDSWQAAAALRVELRAAMAAEGHALEEVSEAMATTERGSETIGELRFELLGQLRDSAIVGERSCEEASEESRAESMDRLSAELERERIGHMATAADAKAAWSTHASLRGEIAVVEATLKELQAEAAVVTQCHAELAERDSDIATLRGELAAAASAPAGASLHCAEATAEELGCCEGGLCEDRLDAVAHADGADEAQPSTEHMAGTAELDIDVNAESEGVPRSRPDGTADTSGQDGEVVGDARPEPQLRNADTVGTAYSDAELNSEDEDVPPLWTEDAEGVTGRDAEVFAKDEGSPSWMDVPVELPSPRRERRSLCQVALAAELASERKACARAVAAAEDSWQAAAALRVELRAAMAAEGHALEEVSEAMATTERGSETIGELRFELLGQLRDSAIVGERSCEEASEESRAESMDRLSAELERERIGHMATAADAKAAWSTHASLRGEIAVVEATLKELRNAGAEVDVARDDNRDRDAEPSDTTKECGDSEYVSIEMGRRGDRCRCLEDDREEAFPARVGCHLFGTEAAAALSTATAAKSLRVGVRNDALFEELSCANEEIKELEARTGDLEFALRITSEAAAAAGDGGSGEPVGIAEARRLRASCEELEVELRERALGSDPPLLGCVPQVRCGGCGGGRITANFGNGEADLHASSSASPRNPMAATSLQAWDTVQRLRDESSGALTLSTGRSPPSIDQHECGNVIRTPQLGHQTPPSQFGSCCGDGSDGGNSDDAFANPASNTGLRRLGFVPLPRAPMESLCGGTSGYAANSSQAYPQLPGDRAAQNSQASGIGLDGGSLHRGDNSPQTDGSCDESDRGATRSSCSGGLAGVNESVHVPGDALNPFSDCEDGGPWEHPGSPFDEPGEAALGNSFGNQADPCNTQEVQSIGRTALELSNDQVPLMTSNSSPTQQALNAEEVLHLQEALAVEETACASAKEEAHCAKRDLADSEVGHLRLELSEEVATSRRLCLHAIRAEEARRHVLQALEAESATEMDPAGTGGAAVLELAGRAARAVASISRIAPLPKRRPEAAQLETESALQAEVHQAAWLQMRRPLAADASSLL